MQQRPLRIGNVSGATGDSPNAMYRMARDGNVDIIVGDWLSEMNIAWNAIAKDQDPSLGYEPGFLMQLDESIDLIVQKKIRVVTNAGALNTEALAQEVYDLCLRKGYQDTKIAVVLGDDISDLVCDPKARRELAHLDHPDWSFEEWPLNPHCGVAYIGAWGIVEALESGADIVICGRVTDASPVVGAAAWWYKWTKNSWDNLAGALVAGHLIECGPYVTGANFSGFKAILTKLIDLSFPIAEIEADGTCVITKCQQHAGAVTKHNTIAQFLYELQGEQYLNPDVVANLHNVRIEEIGSDRIRVYGIDGNPPPETTKAIIAAPGGYQAEATFYINGLDVSEKAEMMRNQLFHTFRDSKFSKLSIELYGSPAADPKSQQEGTVSLRVFAQAKNFEDIAAPKFKIPIYALRMQSYPGYHMNLDFRTMDPKPFMEIFPATINMRCLNHRTRLLPDGPEVKIAPPSTTLKQPVQRPSYATRHPVLLESFGPTQLAPLGSIVHARSGDKANNSNVGFFVRHNDEYPWLQSFLTIARLKHLFGDDWTDKIENGADRIVERCEFPNILAVHFRILDFLDGGIASSSRIDGLGKGIGEFLRSRAVQVPVKFLERGWI